MKALKHLHEVWKIHGAGSFVREFAYLTRNRFVRHNKYIVLSCKKENLPKAVPLLNGLTLRQGTIETFTPYLNLPEYEVNTRILNDTLGAGDKCMCAFDGDKLIAYQFISDRPSPPDTDCILTIPQDYGYLFKAMVLAKYRGRGIKTALVLAATRLSVKNKFLSIVRDNNFSNLRSNEKLGFIKIGSYELRGSRGGDFETLTMDPGLTTYSFSVNLKKLPSQQLQDRNMQGSSGKTDQVK